MILIVAKSVVKPGKVEEFLKLTKPLIEESNKEEGCIEYVLYEDISNSHILTFVEKWTDQEAIDIHNSSPHFKRIVPTLAPLCEAATEVALYKVAN